VEHVKPGSHWATIVAENVDPTVAETATMPETATICRHFRRLVANVDEALVRI